MKEFMPNTHIKGEDARAYAAGELSFDDIADDRSPRIESTLDMYPSQIPAYAWGPETWERKRQIKPFERKLTKAEKVALRIRNADSIEFEKQLVALQFGNLEEEEES